MFTSGEIVQALYLALFQREMDATAKPHVERLRSGDISLAALVREFLSSEEFAAKHARKFGQEFVDPGHFYSAVPSPLDRKIFLATESPSPFAPLPGLNLNWKRQHKSLLQILPHLKNFPYPRNKTAGWRYFINNSAFGIGDAYILHAVIDRFKPRQIIEVGSGYSSGLMMDYNQHFGSEIDLTFIDPHPELVRSLMTDDDHRYRVIDRPIQDVDLHLFEQLRERDILFIDSTHVSKLGSDVNWELFHIIPSLRKGVIVHIHDIYWPFDYPADWIREGRAWNEAYLVRAFLAFNDAFEIFLWPTALARRELETFRRQAPAMLENIGGSLWLRKVA